VVCASRLIDPKLMRAGGEALDDLGAGSTSVSGIAARRLQRISPRMVSSRSDCSLMVWRRLVLSGSCAHRVLQLATDSGVQAWCSRRACARRTGRRRRAWSCRRIVAIGVRDAATASSAISRPTPHECERAGEVLSIRPDESRRRRRSGAAVGTGRSSMPIFDITSARPCRWP
jgi:hypothetical protein